MKFLSLALILVTASAVHAEVKLIAIGKVPHDAVDRSGLTEKLDEGTPHNRLGGFGSGIDRLESDTYVLMPDRGPKDGGSKYRCRFQVAKIVPVGKEITFQLLDTVMLTNADGEPYLGDLTNLKRRLDPEDIRVSPKGTIYISDEYGPRLLEFDRSGKQLREFLVPKRFASATPSGDPKIEARAGKGRAPNRGFESLALTPSGKLVTMLQSPLLQDGGFDGVNVRILELDPKTNATREFVYPIDSPKNGVNALLALGEEDFLVLERDSAAGTNRFAKIFRIRTKNATDVSGVDSIANSATSQNVTPVTKTLFFDLTKMGLTLPEKIEGLAFGPNLADGRRLLLVTTDNDFADHPSQIYGLAVDPDDLK